MGDETVQKQYDQRIGQVARRESNGNNVVNRLEIARSSYDPLAAQPLLPGSSIKGAIRTALLNAALAEQSPNNPFSTFQNQRQRIIPTEAQRPRDAERAYKKLGAALQPQTFGYAENQKILLERDPLRLLRIADAHYQPKEGRFPSHIVWRVNRRNSGVEGKGMATLIEALNASPTTRFQPAAYRGELTVEQGTPLGQDKTPQRRFQLPSIIKACNDFYLAKLKDEVAKLEGKADPKWIAQIQEQVFKPEHNGKTTMGHMIANGKGFLLRIGRHSGSKAVTVDELRRIYIRQHEKFSDAPFTRWLSAANRNQQDSCRPFGWIFVQTKKL
ncbi:MAG: type III-A CRISPR-associated RAMP protein Csm5 [Betaproteobacteria bacterium]|nr:type III-A CRISPR-associated RAMP protein Csm5 [Betaproteobacteria bacterium]